MFRSEVELSAKVNLFDMRIVAEKTKYVQYHHVIEDIAVVNSTSHRSGIGCKRLVSSYENTARDALIGECDHLQCVQRNLLTADRYLQIEATKL